MRRNCNLELRLVPPSVHDNHDHQALMNMFNGNQAVERENQQLTIFYNGRMSVCDVTELQARAIILLASQEMDSKTPTSPPLLQSPLYSPSASTGLSMTKSLQGFLQKRKNRIQATSPYYHHQFN